MEPTSTLGTRPGGGPAMVPAGSGGGLALFQMALAVAVVLALLKYGLPKLVTRLNRQIQPSLDGGIRIQESASFAAGTLYIVTARQKTLLLCASGNGVTCLADLGEAPDPGPTFPEMLEAAPADPEEALARLGRLGV